MSDEDCSDRMTIDAHVHSWHWPEGAYMVIDTYPAKYPYCCECGAFTHNPETGAPCPICAPNDPRLATDTP